MIQSREDALEGPLAPAVRDARLRPAEKRTISEKQLKKLFATAHDNQWEEKYLADMLKADPPYGCGYASRKDVGAGEPFQAVLEALENTRVWWVFQRSEDTDELPFETEPKPDRDMPDIVDATCTDPGGDTISTDYGDRVAADFETEEGEDVTVWEDEGSKKAKALRALRDGESIVLVKEKGKSGFYYRLTDSDIDELASRQNGQRSSGGSNGSGSDPDLPSWGYVQTKARLVGSAYVDLQQRMNKAIAEGNLDPDRRPGEDQVMKAAIASVLD